MRGTLPNNSINFLRRRIIPVMRGTSKGFAPRPGWHGIIPVMRGTCNHLASDPTHGTFENVCKR